MDFPLFRVIGVLCLLLLFPLPEAGAQSHQASNQGPAAGAQAVPYPPYQPLGYAESSSGLDYPQWDGGGSELEMGDVNNDGFVDIVSIGDHGCPYINTQEHGVMVWFGNGLCSWTVFMNGDFGYGGVALGDVNNDGLMDVGYAMHHDYSSSDFGDQLIEVALGDGTGTSWTPWDDGLATNGETWGMFGTDFADYDCDGDLDLGSVSFGAGAGVHLYRNNGDGTWTQTFGFTGGNSNLDFVFGDVNNDGYPDFAAEHEFGSVYLGDGQGGFTLADNNLPSPGPYGARDGLSLGDVNNDGCDDVAWCDSSGGVEVWLFTPTGTWVSAAKGLPASGPAEATQLLDMDGDGTTDIVLFGRGIGAVYRGDGAGNWTLAAAFTAGTPGYCNALRTGADADRNGRPDIVLLSEERSWINSRNHLRFYKETSTPQGLSVRLERPIGHRVLKRGSVRFIEWRSTAGASVSFVVLELSTSGPGGPWQTIASGIPDNGRYQWTVPSAAPPSTDCRIRVSVAVGPAWASAVNRVPFTIE